MATTLNKPAVLDYDDSEDGFRVSARTLRAYEDLERMPGPLRTCVHEYGIEIVRTFIQWGIKDPKTIRVLVHACWQGARQPQQRFGVRGKRSTLGTLDWILSQAGAEITAERLLRVLWEADLAVVPKCASDQMVDASLEICANHDLKVTKRQKHVLRLRAAILAGAKKQWPFLFGGGDS